MSESSELQEKTQLLRPSGPDLPFYRHPPEGESDVFLFSLWRTMMRRRVLLVFTFLGIASLGIFAYMMSPTRYESKAELSYSFDSSDSLQLNDETLGSLGSNDAATKLATQAEILKNRDLTLDVVARLDLARNPEFNKGANPSLNSSNLSPLDQARMVGTFARRLSVRVVPKTYLVTVAFRNSSPQLAQAILTELLHEYVQRNFEARYLDTQQSADWLQKQVDGLRTDVEGKERRLVQLQQQNGLLLMGMPMGQGGGDESGQSGSGSLETTASVRLDQVIKDYVAGQADRINKEAMYRASLTGDPEMLASIMPESKIVSLRQEQVALNGTLASLTSEFGPQWPAVKAAKEQLAEVNEGIHKEVANLQEQLREQYMAAQQGEDLLQKSEQAAEADAFKQIGAAAELVALQEEVESGQRLYEDLERKLKESSVLAGLKSTQVDIVTKPDIAAHPAEPDPMIFGIVTFFLGSVGSISAAVLRERADRTLKNLYEVEEAIRVPVLGQVPHQASTHLLANQLQTTRFLPTPVILSIVHDNPKSRFTESFRSLASSLLLSSTQRPKVILVTSALPGEGKSSISVGLAAILTQKKAHVLLVEADMRRPVLQRSLQSIDGSIGLATLLSGSSSFEQSICCPLEMPMLTILPAGPIPPYPAELLDSKLMTHLLERARTEFDFVIVDTPPLLSVSDALPLTVLADSVLLAVRSRLTRLHALVDTYHLLLRSGRSISGVVLNDVADLDGGQYYYGSYDNYYGETTNSQA